MAAIVLVGWKSYFIGKCAHIFQNAQTGSPLRVLIFKGDTRLFPRACVYNKVCGCLERNGIYWLDIKHPNLQTYARLGWHTAHVCPCIYSLFCTNYRVVIAGVVATFTHLTLFKVDCVHRINNLYNRRWGIRNSHYSNYRVAVGLLIGQGRERKQPTLPYLW